MINYYIGSGDERVRLEKTEAEKDLGVIICDDGKNNRQAVKAINRANSELERLRKTFQFFNIKLFKILYPIFIRPHLEFASPVWNSFSKENIKKMEGIQKRATKMVIELRALSYEDRLKELGLTTLEVRRKRADLIQLYKIKKGVEEVDIDIGGGNQGGYQGRGHNQQIIREKIGNIHMRNNSLPNRNATTWNLLPSDIVGADNV